MLTVVRRAGRDRFVGYRRAIESKAAGALACSLSICGPACTTELHYPAWAAAPVPIA